MKEEAYEVLCVTGDSVVASLDYAVSIVAINAVCSAVGDVVTVAVNRDMGVVFDAVSDPEFDAMAAALAVVVRGAVGSAVGRAALGPVCSTVSENVGGVASGAVVDAVSRGVVGAVVDFVDNL